MEIKILGAHNTESLNTRLAGILVDGVLALDAGSLTSSLGLDEQLKLEAVLLTHRHYDHIRDIPALGMGLFLSGKSLDIYAPTDALKVLTDYCLNGDIYPRFTHKPAEKPVLVFKPVNPGKEFDIGSYHVLPVAMPHSVPSVGYLIEGAAKGRMFYTGDTGLGFADSITKLAPDVLIVEVTAPSRFGDIDWEGKHLTPAFLEEELAGFRAVCGYLPRIYCVHMSKVLEDEIKAELSEVAGKLGADITTAHEGIVITL